MKLCNIRRNLRRNWHLVPVMAMIGVTAFVTPATLFARAAPVAAPRFSVELTGSRSVRGILFGKSTQSDVMAVLGKGKESIGYHCNSARVWSLGGGVVLETDGKRSNGSQYIVDKVLLYSDLTYSSGLPRARHAPLIKEAYLGEPVSELTHRLKGRYQRTDAYDRDAIEWKTTDPASHRPMRIVVAATKGIVDFVVLDTQD